MNFRKTVHSNNPSGTNLRNILNEARMPINNRINERANLGRSPHSYFDKLKKKIDYSEKYRFYDKNLPRFPKPIANPRCTHSQKTKTPLITSQYLEQLRIQTEMNTINHSQIDSETITQKQSNYQHHYRTKSLLDGSSEQLNKTDLMERQNQDRTYRITNLEKGCRSRRKKNLDEEILQIKAQLLNRQRTTSHKTLSNLNRNKNKKHEYINYAKYEAIYSDKDGVPQSWGKILLKDVLGVGAHACVRLGVCKNIEFAVKIYEKYKLLEPRKKKRVYKEIQVLRKIPSHPNVISLVQAFEDNKQIHMIFENVENAITLHQHFRNNMLYLEEKDIKLIFYRLVRGVYHLHSCGVAHRDIKPDNVLIGTDQDGQMIIKIIDLGFATTTQTADLHCGTPNFMAPQLLQKSSKYNPMSVDIWALGVTLFYLCEGRYPFKGYDEKDLFRCIRKGEFQIRKTESAQIANIIKATIHPDPIHRITIKQLLKNQWFCSL